jgi:hypothetical protein
MRCIIQRCRTFRVHAVQVPFRCCVTLSEKHAMRQLVYVCLLLDAGFLKFSPEIDHAAVGAVGRERLHKATAREPCEQWY